MSEESPPRRPPADTQPPGTSKPTRHARRWIAAAVAGGGLTVLVLWHAFPRATSAARNPNAGRAVPVVADSVRSRDFAVHLTALGTVTPLKTVTVRTRVDGQLMSVHFTEGQTVAAGALLAVLDPRPFQAMLDQARAQLSRDSSSLENARIDLDRYQQLLKLDSVAKQQVDTQVALVKQDEAQIQLDRAAVESAGLQLEYSRIHAEVGGRVGLRLVDPGNIVHAADAGGLTVITQLQPISVLFAIPQRALSAVLPRFQSHEPLPVSITGADGQTPIGIGRVVAIDNEIDPTTGTVKVRAEFPNADGRLFPNQFVNVRLLQDELASATVVPSAAVQRGPIGTFAYVVGAGDTVHVRPLTLGPSEGESAVALDGVSAGDLVVVDGVDRLREGAVVQLLPAASQKGSTARGPGGHKHAGRRA
jgi:multidrug efflux system membrane fusion protein